MMLYTFIKLFNLQCQYISKTILWEKEILAIIYILFESREDKSSRAHN